jgi:hypothetical protein
MQTTRLIAHIISSEPLRETSDIAFEANIAEAWQAAGIMLFAILIILSVWFTLSRLPKPTVLMSAHKQIKLARSIGIITVLAVAAVSWDTWWHRAIGRDTIWEPPHLLLYTFAVYCILASLYGWYATQNSKWKMVALVLLMIPIGAPFDQLWHTYFGIENLTRPVAMLWAPPHLMIAFASSFTLLFLLPILENDTVQSLRHLMGVLIFGTLTATGLFLLLPVHPTEGWGQLLGLWGALPMSAVIVAGPLIGRAWLRDEAGATKLMLVTVLLLLVAYTQEMAPHVTMIPHDTMPNWLIVWVNVMAAAWLDASSRFSFFWRGLIAGTVSSACMFGIARYFLDPEFFYGTDKVVIAIVAGGIGGILGAMIAKKAINTFRCLQT